MRRSSLLAAAGLFLFAACGGGAPSGSQPAGASVRPGVPTVPPGGVPVSQLCQGQPTFSLQTPQPTFASDAELNARFPAQIAGQAPTDVRSTYWLQTACYFSGASEDLAEFAAIFPPSTLPLISSGSAAYTIDGDEITISAFRIPGTDPSVIFTNFPAFLTAFGVEQSEIPLYNVAQANIGGKNVWVVTDPDGDKSYSVVSGDIVFTANDVTDAQAATIVAAIP